MREILCRLFFMQISENAYSKQSGWNIRFKMFKSIKLCYSVNEAND